MQAWLRIVDSAKLKALPSRDMPAIDVHLRRAAARPPKRVRAHCCALTVSGSKHEVYRFTWISFRTCCTLGMSVAICCACSLFWGDFTFPFKLSTPFFALKRSCLSRPLQVYAALYLFSMSSSTLDV